MKQLLFLLLAIALFCCNRQSALEEKLIKSKWVLYEGTTLRNEFDKWPPTYLRFYDNGKVKECLISSEVVFISKKQAKIRDDWKYTSEKLNLFGKEFKVLAVEGDTIRLQRDTTNFMLYNIDKTYPKLKKGPGRCLGG